jgi:hypothetical protein
MARGMHWAHCLCLMDASFCCRVGEAHGTWAFQTCLMEALLSHVSVVARLLLLNQNTPSRVTPEFAACTVPQSNIMEVVRHVLHRGGSRPPKSYSVQCFIVLPQHLQLAAAKISPLRAPPAPLTTPSPAGGTAPPAPMPTAGPNYPPITSCPPPNSN